jgi:RNA polymerase sigma-70 factor (ECF subfamily)
MEVSDAEAVKRVLDGDSDAYAILVGRYSDRYVRYASQMLGSREDAEEALQDALVRAFRSLRNCEDPERFGAWLFQILTNRCRTAGARRGRREQTFVRDEIALMNAASEHPADQRALREEIYRALDLLDAEQREAFLLKHVEGLSYEEISEMTGAGVSALKMRVKRACDRLKVSLQEVYLGRAG